jgi:hypothetical protein
MTVNAAGRPRRRSVKSASEPVAIAPVDSYAIGEINQTVFDCPSCSRPLALGTRRCPGCRTRLLLGVPLSKAVTFAAPALALGIAVGSIGGVVFAATRPIPAGVPTTVASAAPITGASAGTGSQPTTAPMATASPSSAPWGTAPAIPPLARSAILQAIDVNGRLAGASDALRTALATSPFDASQVAEVLRSISADSVYGADVADRISGWPESATIGADLSKAYGSVHDAAADILVASVRNTAAYRDGARGMLTLLAAVGGVDARIRRLADANGVVLPAQGSQP